MGSTFLTVLGRPWSRISCGFFVLQGGVMRLSESKQRLSLTAHRVSSLVYAEVVIAILCLLWLVIWRCSTCCPRRQGPASRASENEKLLNEYCWGGFWNVSAMVVTNCYRKRCFESSVQEETELYGEHCGSSGCLGLWVIFICPLWKVTRPLTNLYSRTTSVA